MSRQQRRIQLKQAMEALSRRGMDFRASESDLAWAVIAETRILYDILSGHSPARASAAARRAHEFFEISLKNNPSRVQAECVRGCAFCCHLTVTATAPEIFLVASHIREQRKDDFEPVFARIMTAEMRSRGLGAMERARRRIPCVLLDGNVCTVYDVRPRSCRSAASVSRRTCEAGFMGAPVKITTPPEWVLLKSAHHQALWAALVAANLPADTYELNQSISLALAMPDAEARWLKGEDVFAGVARESAAEAMTNPQNRAIIDRLIAGALGKEPSR